MEERFWFRDPRVLVTPEFMDRFFPAPGMSLDELFNAYSRLALYVGVVLALMFSATWPLALAAFVLAVIVFVYENHTGPAEEPAQRPDDRDFQQYVKDHPLGEDRQYTMPTPDNPFMNMLQYEIGEDPNRPPAAPLFLPAGAPGSESGDPRTDAGKLADYYLMRDTYRDDNDIWNRNNGQREFYTVPSTTLGDSLEDLKNALYGNMKSCKDDRFDCVPYTDLRAQRYDLSTAPHGAASIL